MIADIELDGGPMSALGQKRTRSTSAGLGILAVRNRAARVGRNPATGETIHIKASKKVAFRPGKMAI